MELSGNPLSLEEIASVAYGREPVQVAASARPRILASRKVVDDIVTRDAVVYGVNTGFGKLSDVRIPHGKFIQLFPKKDRSAPVVISRHWRISL